MPRPGHRLLALRRPRHGPARAPRRTPLRPEENPLRNVLAIFRRELASYFDSPLAYIVVPIFLALVGGFSLWFNDILAAGVASMRTVFFWSAVFYLLLIPAVTMRLFAEERRTGSLEMLVTMPVTEPQMVLGKYLAALTLMTLALGLTITYPLTLSALGDLDWGPVIGGYLGLFLLGAAFCAIGTAASALTRNQVVAFLLALIICVVPYATGFALSQVPPSLLPVVQHLSFQTHIDDLARGIVDTRSLVWFGSISGLFLHVAVFALEHRRLS